jgi:hypothetical protein
LVRIERELRRDDRDRVPDYLGNVITAVPKLEIQVGGLLDVALAVGECRIAESIGKVSGIAHFDFRSVSGER